MRPSGNVGELGDSGDIGECKTGGFREVESRIMLGDSGDVGRGAAFLGGSSYSCIYSGQ